ncbi:hypothetical protein ABZW10_33065 [Kitasatospora sp. NPDC004723]|uniref:hypothetical protein n=1 Tax=Kitasatospora sp. NPDC004723 TaxID=3154288 RepID=UPI0033AB17BA
MIEATDTPAGRVRHFMSFNRTSPVAARLIGPGLDPVEVSVADLSALVFGSATKAQESNVRAFLAEYETRMEIDDHGTTLHKADLRDLLDQLDPDRDDPDDLIEVSVEWPEGSEDFRLTRSQLGDVLARIEAMAADNED